MSFSQVPNLPAIDGVSTISAANINAIRAMLPYALDSLNGGTYLLAPSAVVAFTSGGGRWQMDAQFTASYFNAPAHKLALAPAQARIVQQREAENTALLAKKKKVAPPPGVSKVTAFKPTEDL